MSETLIKAENISKSFGDLKVLCDISFTLEKGKVLSILGPSGSGKSTLLRIVTQLETADRGSLSFSGESLFSDNGEKAVYASAQNARKIGLKTGLVFQNFNLFPHFTVLRNITEAQVAVLKRDKKEAEERAFTLLKKLSLEDKAKAYPCQLSGGQKQRVSIARALAMDPEVLFFDETTSALDPELTREVLNVIRKLSEEKMTMAVVTHEMEFAKAISDHAVFMEGGYIIEEGDKDTIFVNPEKERTRQFIHSMTS
ncbi:MAG: amino acid ABC transporter ATP-binding protein [Bullifex sp.]